MNFPVIEAGKDQLYLNPKPLFLTGPLAAKVMAFVWDGTTNIIVND